MHYLGAVTAHGAYVNEKKKALPFLLFLVCHVALSNSSISPSLLSSELEKDY
jgi:hypothetical protein